MAVDTQFAHFIPKSVYNNNLDIQKYLNSLGFGKDQLDARTLSSTEIGPQATFKYTIVEDNIFPGNVRELPLNQAGASLGEFSATPNIGWHSGFNTPHPAYNEAITEVLNNFRQQAAPLELAQARLSSLISGICPTSTPMRQFERLEERRISGSS